MRRFLLGLFIAVLVGLFSVAIFAGCTMSKSGPHSGCAYFQRTRGHRVHIMRDRIYDTNDYRYKHDLHDTRGK